MSICKQKLQLYGDDIASLSKTDNLQMKLLKTGQPLSHFVENQS